MKKLLTILASAFLFLGAYSFARSEECARPFPAFVGQVTNLGVTVRPLTDHERVTLLEKKGPPPFEPPFSFAIAQSTEQAILLVIKDDCIVANIGPAPITFIHNLIGTVNAGE